MANYTIHCCCVEMSIKKNRRKVLKWLDFHFLIYSNDFWHFQFIHPTLFSDCIWYVLPFWYTERSQPAGYRSQTDAQGSGKSIDTIHWSIQNYSNVFPLFICCCRYSLDLMAPLLPSIQFRFGKKKSAWAPLRHLAAWMWTREKLHDWIFRSQMACG